MPTARRSHSVPRRAKPALCRFNCGGIPSKQFGCRSACLEYVLELSGVPAVASCHSNAPGDLKMINQSIVRRLLLGAATGLALAVTGVSVPLVAASLPPAIAQSSEDMTAALDAYGHWIRHPRYGEVWVPDGVPPGWRPYEYGRWVFTDDWGWYWVSEEREDDWGWVVYHYGRWAVDRSIGWFWVPGDEWAPAWVDWRYGGDNVGWAPLPPDDLVDAYDEQPDYWMFVPLRYIAEPRVRTHFVPRDRRMFILRETRL